MTLVSDRPRELADVSPKSVGGCTAEPNQACETGVALKSHYRFILWLVLAVERFPRSRRYLLGDRIQTTALDVLERLIEATYTKRRGSYLMAANLGLEKLRFLFRLARDLKILDLRRYEFAAGSIVETGRKVATYSKAK